MGGVRKIDYGLAPDPGPKTKTLGSN